MKHKHHIIPKHMGGTNNPENLIELTVEEHAEAHRKLWEQHGKWQDFCAWKTLLGTMTLSEAKRYAAASSRKGKKHTKETRRKMSESHRGVKLSEHHKRNIGKAHKGRPCSPEKARKISIAKMGKPGTSPSEETRQKLREAAPNKACSVDGNKFTSITAAAEAFEINRTTALYRFRSSSSKFINWQLNG